MTENYDEYDVSKGRVIHKIYGKQVGGSETLKASPSSSQTLKAVPSSAHQILKAAKMPQLAQPQLSGGMMMARNSSPRNAIDSMVRSEAGQVQVSVQG